MLAIQFNAIAARYARKSYRNSEQLKRTLGF